MKDNQYHILSKGTMSGGGTGRSTFFLFNSSITISKFSILSIFLNIAFKKVKNKIKLIIDPKKPNNAKTHKKIILTTPAIDEKGLN